MNYTLHQLLIFSKVAEKQSITKAAELLHLTQPAVSIQLKNFQDQFDSPLIESIGRMIYITEFGREIEEICNSILTEIEEIRLKNMAYQGFMAGKIHISVVSTAKYVMPYFLSGFLKKYPKVDLIMDVTNRGSVLEHVEKNEVDFAMVSVLPKNIQIERIELMKNELYLIGNANSELGDSINLKTLEKLPLIYREQGSATRQAMERFIKDHKINAQKTIELTSNEAVKQSVLAGLGYSIMPKIGLKNSLEKGELKIINIKDLPIVTNWNLVWRKDKSFSPAASAYLEYLKNHKEEIMKEQFNWI